MKTEDIFKEMGFNYNNVNEREALYRYNRDCQEEAEQLWDEFVIVDGDKEAIFKKWLDYCYTKKIPYIIFFGGIALTPRSYDEWERLLEMTVIRKAQGLATAITRMASKDMELIDYTPAKDLLEASENVATLLPDYRDREKLTEKIKEIVED